MTEQLLKSLPPLPETLEEFNLRANSEASRFYETIETLLKRHQPDAWGPFATQRLQEAWRDTRLLAYAPPHHVLNSIEANCAYVRGQNRDPVDSQKFSRVLSSYVKRLDLWQCWLAAKQLSQLALVMHREQLELQYHHSAKCVARFIELFSSSAIPTLSAKFYEQYAITTDDWIRICYGVFANAANASNGCIWRHVTEAYATETLKISLKGVDSFFRQSSSTPKEIGERYKKLRKDTKPRFHSLIRSAFLETPMIAFEDGRLLVPHPPLVFRHCGEGLCRLLKELPGFQDSQKGFQQEFGDTVERYVGKLLSCVSGKIRLLRSGELATSATGESCDLLLETMDSIFLVESKSTTIRANILTEEVIINDGSNKHVTKGLTQLSQTAKDIRQGAFQSLGVDSSKPVIGMVVTLGEIPFANSDWYFDTFFRKRTEEKIGTPVDANFGLSEKPAVVSVAAFEMVVTAIEQFRISPLALFKEKAEHSYLMLGDWEAYVRNKLSQAGEMIDPLPFVTEQMNAFFKSLGIPQDESSAAVFRAPGVGLQVTKNL